VGRKMHPGDKLIVEKSYDERTNTNARGVEVITQIFEEGTVDADGNMTSVPTVEITIFDTEEQAKKYIEEKYQKYKNEAERRLEKVKAELKTPPVNKAPSGTSKAVKGEIRNGEWVDKNETQSDDAFVFERNGDEITVSDFGRMVSSYPMDKVSAFFDMDTKLSPSDKVIITPAKLRSDGKTVLKKGSIKREGKSSDTKGTANYKGFSVSVDGFSKHAIDSDNKLTLSTTDTAKDTVFDFEVNEADNTVRIKVNEENLAKEDLDMFFTYNGVDLLYELEGIDEMGEIGISDIESIESPVMTTDKTGQLVLVKKGKITFKQQVKGEDYGYPFTKEDDAFLSALLEDDIDSALEVEVNDDLIEMLGELIGIDSLNSFDKFESFSKTPVFKGKISEAIEGMTLDDLKRALVTDNNTRYELAYISGKALVEVYKRTKGC